jgi:oligosaccharide repeat unit polymerase
MIKFNESLHWIYFLFFPWLTIFLLRGSSFIGFEPLSTELLIFLGIFILLSVISFSLGVFCARSVHPKLTRLQSRASYTDLYFLAVMAGIFICTSAYDFFLIKGGTLSTIVTIRELEHLSGPRMSLIGGLITLTSAAPFALLSYLMFCIETGKKVAINYFLIIALCGISSSFLTGGRNSFVIGMTVITVQYVLTREKLPVFRLDRYQRWTLFLFLTFFIFYSQNLFLAREIYQGVDIASVLEYFAKKNGIMVKDFQSGFQLIDAIYSSIIIFIYYLTHSLGFLDKYFTSNLSPLFNGGYSFHVLTRALGVVFATGYDSNIQTGLLVQGVYLSMPGSFYVDFGYFGSLLVASVFGLVSGVLYGWRNHLRFALKLLLCSLLASYFLSPLYFAFGIANGFSFVFIVCSLQGRRCISSAGHPC